MNKILWILAATSMLFSSCNKKDDDPALDYKQEMRDFVTGISEFAKATNPGFAIIPQNGIELVTTNGEADGEVNTSYLDAIDGHGQEDLFYGYDNDDDATPETVSNYLKAYLDLSKDAGNKILVIDYCSTHSNMDNSYTVNNNHGYISFAADQRALNNIPTYPGKIYAENDDDITSLSEAKNFLYLINLENYASRTAFINAVTATNYDVLIMDLFFNDGTAFTSTEINQLKSKANGGSRLVISYMSIGEAEDYRFYWSSSWDKKKPSWIDAENPDWPGNYKVKYWNSDWQKIIYGSEDSYLKKILNANFDGVYLDIIDAFEYYE